MEQYSIDLPIFEGPFDLLLFFIKRDEIDIHDIPIAKITEDFLTYIEEAKRLDISLASDFIVMAASLIRIKSKTLLPRYNQEIEEGGEDPRQSLAHQLLVYQQYKEASEWLKELADTRALCARRGQNAEEGRRLAEALQREAIPLESPSLNALHRAYVRLLQQQKYRNAPKHEVKEAAFTLKEKKQWITHWLSEKDKAIEIEAILSQAESRLELVYNFLGLLELIQEQHITILASPASDTYFVSIKPNDATDA